MKYKALVMGKSNSIIDDFFIHMDDAFEVISSSTRYGDIIRHLKYFVPDVFIYCLYNEATDSMRQMIGIKPLIQQTRTPFVIVGAKEDCDEFDRLAVNVSNLTIAKPFTASSLKEKIINFLDERQEYVEAYRKKNGIGEDGLEEEVPNRRDIASMDIADLKNAFSNLDALLNETKEEKQTPVNPAPANTAKDAAIAPNMPNNADAPMEEERKHILVIDDDPIMLKTVKEQLHDDYDVATAISGKIAMKFLERRRTDLILLDYEMPVENGPAVLGKIRENDAIRDIPVVFLTGVSDREKIKEAIALKPQGYLLKPIDHDKLMETINNYT